MKIIANLACSTIVLLLLNFLDVLSFYDVTSANIKLHELIRVFLPYSKSKLNANHCCLYTESVDEQDNKVKIHFDPFLCNVKIFIIKDAIKLYLRSEYPTHFIEHFLMKDFKLNEALKFLYDFTSEDIVCANFFSKNLYQWKFCETVLEYITYHLQTNDIPFNFTNTYQINLEL
ncbi:hypothetical protein I4U23_021739 [Adineta vaga]|nr:hypothetical protein I4U23_021739 [Adineta vaga]